MQCAFPAGVIAGIVLAAGLTLGAAAGAAPPPAAAPTVDDCAAPCAAQAWAGPRGPGVPRARLARLAHAIRHDPAVAVVRDLRAIERVYRREGRDDELPAFYTDMLERTRDPLVRNFVNYRLARLQLRERDADAALAALRRNLEENLGRIR